MNDLDIIPGLQPAEWLQVREAALAAAITGIALGDLEGKLLYVNPAFLQMWQCEEVDALGHSAAEFWDSPADARLIMDHLRTQGSWDGELVARRRDDSLFDVQLDALLIRDPDERPLCMLGIFLDVTNRKRVELALQERIKELHIIYRLSDLAQNREITLAQFLHQVTEVLPTGLQYADDAYAAITLEEHTYTSLTFRDTPWQLRSSIHIEGKIAGEVLVGYCSQHRSVEEDPFLAEERSLLDEVSYRITQFVERRREQEALGRSEARYRGLFENSPIPIFEQDFSAVKQQIETWRKEGVVDFRAFFRARPDLISECISLIEVKDFSTASLELYGASSEAELSEGVDRLVPPEGHHLFVDELVWIAEGRRSFQWEGLNRKLNGELINVRLHWAAVPGYEESLSRVLVSIEDITELKSMQRGVVRSERLAAMGQVTAVLAHEIQNPLQAIQSNLELMVAFPLDADEHDECLRISYLEVERLRELTHNILNMSRISSETYRSVSVAEAWRRAFSLFQKALHNATIDVVVALPDSLPTIRGSQEQLTQVLINLILNSIDCMPNGGEIRIDGHSTDDHLIVTFCNNGPPIPSGNLPHLFEPFFTTKPSGAGLGLFGSHMIVRQHNGDLSARNLPDGQGVEFTLAFPIESTTQQDNGSTAEISGL